jgi:serine/threonine protein kinase
MTELTRGSTLAGRYRVDGPRADGQGYLAKAQKTNAVVHAVQVPPGMLSALNRTQQFTHSRFCPVLEVVAHTDGSKWAIVKHVAGSPLDQVLKDGGTLPPEVAVMIGIDLADALVGLHQKGGAHGLIRPAAVLVDPKDYSGAMLGFAPPLPDPHSYHPPEPDAEVVSPATDVWALAGVVHFMLLGEPPPTYGYPSRELVPHAGMPPDLIDFLAACLCQQPAERVQAAHSMRDMLACSRANSLRPGAFSGQPPPPVVVVPEPMPNPANLAPGLAAPVPPTPLSPPRVQHISIPKPQLAPAQEPGRWILAAAFGAALLALVAIVLALLSMR